MATMRQWIGWAEHQIAGVIVGEQLHCVLRNVVQGPLTVTFQLRLVRPSATSLRKLLSLGPALAQALRVEAVRVSDTADGVLVEIPSPQPRTPTARLLCRHSHGLNVAVGLDQWRKPVTVNLAHHPTLLFVGPSRKGKTQAMKSVLYALASRNRPHTFQFAVFTKKREDWASFAELCACWGIVVDAEETTKALEWVAGFLLQERAADGYKNPALLLVLDDLLNILHRAPEVAGPIGEIASMGGGVGIYQMIGTQDAGSKRGTGGMDVEANITARIVYRASSATSAARATGQSSEGVEMLSGHRGDGLLIVDGEVRRIATAYADDREIIQLPSGRVTEAPWAVMGRISASRDVDTRVDTASDKGDLYPAVSGYNQISQGTSSPLIGTTTPIGRGVKGDDGNNDIILSDETSEAPSVDEAPRFPIGQARPLTASEKRAVREMALRSEFQYRGEISLNRLTIHVYGSKNPDRVAWVRQALVEDAAADVDDQGAIQNATAHGEEVAT